MAWQCRIDTITVASPKFLDVGYTVFDDTTPTSTRSATCQVKVEDTLAVSRNVVLAAARATRDELALTLAAQAVAAQRQSLVGQTLPI